ncbi:MAG TPA: Hint domain-containing protein [Puia sp.]|nr:Hint domain-containing protein [Puia sp.]
MKKIIMIAVLLSAGIVVVHAQDTTSGRALSLAEYEKAKTFAIGDLDKDTYVKFENTYILDHHDFGKPYFITGDDGQKKRIDLYKLILKEGRVDLGTVIFYTTEKGRRYTACLPGYKADPKIWEKYFEDIHAIDKGEPNFVLKLSYVLSKELGFQLYRATAAGQGKDANKERESGTYGNDICFPGTMQVTMADGSTRDLSGVKAGDEIVTVDPATRMTKRVQVKELTVHEAKNYAITRILLLAVEAHGTGDRDVQLRSKWLEATPNHPMVTREGNKKAGELKEGDGLLCRDEPTGAYRNYTVWYKTEAAGGLQRVYNIVAGGGTTFVMNGVMVSQK